MSNQKENAISRFFDRESHRMKDRHEKKGLPKSAQEHAMAITSASAKTALDVGCGTGTLMAELLDKGVEKVIGIDLSEKMCEIATQQLTEEGYSNERFEVRKCTYLEYEPQETIDAISLHRVMCCHPSAKQMARHSAELSPKLIVNTIPRNWKLIRAILKPIAWIADRKGAYRPYLHNQNEIDMEFRKQGYEILHRKKGKIWVTTVYVKKHQEP